jgi:hypothetical protein
MTLCAGFRCSAIRYFGDDFLQAFGFATLSIPKRWRFPDRELTSGLL